MRIKSDFHDYYDCGQKFGQDQTLVWIRKRADFPISSILGTKHLPFPAPERRNHSGYTRQGDLPSAIRFYIIGFAYKLYPVFELEWNYSDYSGVKDHTSWCYNLADIDKAITTHCDKKNKSVYNEAILKGRSKRSWRIGRYFIPIHRAEFENFYDNWSSEDQSIKAKNLFKDCPIWSIEERHDGWYICFNCSLKEFKFFKVKDPIAAYQEVSMFVGNIAVPQKPIPVPSDKDMVSIKGFDRFSFRKDPSKK